ncbi:MFS transporter [uncultured Methanobrevibacter sp.]|uniref:MFS transporter n=1 Tax=uncultured Methanobrevibacter sp. TaxID=253161 RepID=UPI0026363CB1|nr:MFS transporter [uncultured Methanobrevibacter sp.]
MNSTKKRNIIIIIVASLASFYGAYMGNVTPVALPQIAEIFKLSNIMQNWITNTYLLTMAVLAIPLGKLCSKYGVKKTFICSVILMLIGTIGTPLSNTVSGLLFFRVIQGIGGAGLCVDSMLIIAEAISPESRGQALGMNISLTYIGIALAPVLGGSLTYNFGWESIFWVMVPFIILNLILLFMIDNEWFKYQNEKFDLKGSLIFAIGILLLIYGFSILNTLIGLVITLLGIILLIIFCKIELKTKHPAYDIKLYKNKKFLSSNIASVLSYIATFVVTTIVNYNLQYIKGFDSQISGLILITFPLLMAIVAPSAGKLSDKIDPQKIATIGMIIVTIGLILIVPLNKDTSIILILISLSLQGIGYGLFASPNTNTIMSSVPPKDTPMASSAVATMRIIGQTISTGILTVIFAILMGNVLIQPSNYPQLIFCSQITLIIITIISAICFVVCYIGYKSKDKLYL